jgi:1-acyl-sn-glycerol-3-phosphate acyltransferase
MAPWISYIMRLGARALAAARVDLTVTGLEHVPASGPALLVARHYHYLLDGVVLLTVLPRPIHILVTLDWVKRSYARRLLGLATAMARWPVVRRGGAPAGERHVTAGDQRRGLDESVELLVEGRVLVVFPEGYPNIDPHYTPKTRPEEMLPFKHGFAVIAAAAEKQLEARVPIVPAGFHYMRHGRWTVRLRIGEAIYLEDFSSRQLLVAHLERRVAELSGSVAAGSALEGS